MRYIYDVTNEDIETWVKTKGYPGFRSKQIAKWIARGICTFDAMTDLPLAAREALAEDFYIDGVLIKEKILSALDETIKYIIRLKDGNVIECVLMRYHHGNSICISSQAGCKMGCTFCASTGIGFGRDLSCGEMFAQVAVVAADIGERISNIVIMGIGEPLDNYENLVCFLRKVNNPEGLGVGMRHISVSTCGLVPEMIKFTDEGLPVTLSVSLHASNDVTRKALMPIANRYTLRELMEACRNHVRATNRRITFEYSLFDGINDSQTDALELAGLLKGMLCHVNLIPANEFSGCNFKKSSAESVKKFKAILTDNGINATVRRELGVDILAACGQLRRNITEGDGKN